MFNIFINKTIIGFFSVRVIEEEECFDLTDTLVVKFLNNEMLQIIIEDPFKKTLTITNESDLEIWGDFDPVEIKLIPLNIMWLKTPFLVNKVTMYYTTDSRISGYWEGINNQGGNEYILGATLNDNKKECFIRTAYENLVLETTPSAITFFKKCNLKYRTN